MFKNFVIKLRRTEDVGFCLKVSIIQSLAFLLGALLPLIIDPKLLNHVRFGARSYSPLAYWLTPILSIVTLVATFWILAIVPRKRRIWLATLPTLLFSLPMFWMLRPEFPHMELFDTLFLASLLTIITIWVRYHPTESAYIDNPNILAQAKLERVKEEITFWRTGTWAALAGYLALLVSWFNSMVKMNETITSDHSE